MKRCCGRLAAIALLVFVVVSAVSACRTLENQSGDETDDDADTDPVSSGIYGIVYDHTDGGVPDMDVVVRDQEKNEVGFDETDFEGHYEITVPPGLYDVITHEFDLHGVEFDVPVEYGEWVEVNLLVQPTE